MGCTSLFLSLFYFLSHYLDLIHSVSVSPLLLSQFFFLLQRQTGLLALPDEDNSMDYYINSLKTCEVPHEILSGKELKARYPRRFKIPDSYQCLYEKGAGVLKATKSLAKLQVSSSIV